jgi:hypothetical protein
MIAPYHLGTLRVEKPFHSFHCSFVSEETRKRMSFLIGVRSGSLQIGISLGKPVRGGVSTSHNAYP